MSVGKGWFERTSQPRWQYFIKPLGPFLTYLEIGTYCGDSLIWFAENCAAQGAVLHAVDPWSSPGTGYGGHVATIAKAKQIALSRIAEFREKRPDVEIVVHNETSRSFFAKCELRDIQVVFVDGVHEAWEAANDMEAAWEILAVGGIMIVDDLHMRQGHRGRTVPHVYEAWCAFYDCHRGDFKRIYKVKRQTAVRKLR